MKKSLKTSLLYEQFRTKKSGIKTGYMAYLDPDLLFVVYHAYVNMSILDKKKYFELIPDYHSPCLSSCIYKT